MPQWSEKINNLFKQVHLFSTAYPTQGRRGGPEPIQPIPAPSGEARVHPGQVYLDESQKKMKEAGVA